MEILCSVSLGELVDKISILLIKQKHIQNEEKLKFIKEEETSLRKTLENLKLSGVEQYLDDLVAVNSKLWVIEDQLRDKERAKNFDHEFIELARSVYFTNDLRFKIKNEINEKFGSSLREMKSYSNY